MKRSLSQRNYQLVEAIREREAEAKQRERDGFRMRHRTLDVNGALVAVGPAIEAVPIGEGAWAA